MSLLAAELAEDPGLELSSTTTSFLSTTARAAVVATTTTAAAIVGIVAAAALGGHVCRGVLPTASDLQSLLMNGKLGEEFIHGDGFHAC